MKKNIKNGLLWALLALLTAGCAPNAVGADAGWMTDYDAALKQAASENKYILVDFSGSDWCGWCIKLDKEVFSKTEFIDYAKENLVLILADFPRQSAQSGEQKAANDALAQKYGVQGFPTVLILNPEGEVVERTGYQQGGAAAYVEMIKSVIAN